MQIHAFVVLLLLMLGISSAQAVSPDVEAVTRANQTLVQAPGDIALAYYPYYHRHHHRCWYNGQWVWCR
jgi:hypothetical protein